MLRINIKNPRYFKRFATQLTLYTVAIMPVLLSFSFNDTKAYAAVTTGNGFSIEQIEIDTNVPTPTAKQQNIPVMKALQPQTNTISKYTINSTSDAYEMRSSQTSIDFGALSPTNPVIRTSKLFLLSPLQGAQIIANENRPMTATNKQFVPDTTCDNGSCTSGLAANWESTLTYGFGYRCESETAQVCDYRFSSPQAYKQFADASANESFNTIILSQQSKQITEADIIYKINISGTQPLGGYRNTITYIAVPNF